MVQLSTIIVSNVILLERKWKHYRIFHNNLVTQLNDGGIIEIPGIHLGDLLARSEEKSVAELHYVSFVNTRDLLAIIFHRVIEGKLGDSLTFRGGYDF